MRNAMSDKFRNKKCREGEMLAQLPRARGVVEKIFQFPIQNS
jgi:hypothetical protein